MALGISKSKYYKDNNDFARKIFFASVVIVSIIFVIALSYKGCGSLGYKSDCIVWEEKLSMYHKFYKCSYESAKYIKEDCSTSFRGIVFKVTNFRDSSGFYKGDHYLTWYGTGGYGSGASSWDPDHYIID